jgi:methionyl-tRNA synthetase
MSEEKISIDQFKNVEIKIGKILSVEIVPDADKLLKLSVDMGEEEPRQILSGIRMYFEEPQILVGKKVPFVANLAPRTIRGLESNGMILAVNDKDGNGFFTFRSGGKYFRRKFGRLE